MDITVFPCIYLRADTSGDYQKLACRTLVAMHRLEFACQVDNDIRLMISKILTAYYYFNRTNLKQQIGSNACGPEKITKTWELLK